MTEPITLYHDFPAKGVPHIFWTIRLKCLLAQITVPWHFYGPIQFQDYTAGYFLTHERTIHLPQKYRTTVKLQQHIFSKGHTLSIGWFLLDPFHRRGRVLDRKFCLSVCLCVCLSVITFSFSEYWRVWWFTPCKPYIFWKHITLATTTALFWPSTTKYQPVPQWTDPVPPSNNRDK